MTWIPTSLLIIFGYIFSQLVLRMSGKKALSLILIGGVVICGESAAIAIASVVGGSKDDALTFVVSLIAITSVLQMIVIPFFVLGVGMDPVIAAGWIGGSVDTTSGVVAVAETLGGETQVLAPLIKIIQNLMIGVVCVVLGVLWTLFFDEPKTPSHSINVTNNIEQEAQTQELATPSSTGSLGIVQKLKKCKWGCKWLIVLYENFPKFVVGYFLLMVIFSFLVEPFNPRVAKEVYEFTGSIHRWWFCLGLVAIGLETNIRSVFKQLQDFRVAVLFVTMQISDFGLDYLFSWLAFGGIIWPKR